MTAYALSSGMGLPQSITDALDVLNQEAPPGPPLAALATLHTALARLIAPATPRGLRAIRQDRDQHKWLHGFGAVPVLRHLLLAAFGFSFVFFATGVQREINPENLAIDIYASYGWTAVLVMAFLLSTAGIGAVFGALFNAYKSVSEGNYDPKLDSIYWVRIGIGLMAGLMLAQLIPLPPRDPSSAATLTRPLLALLGGYSASVVHRILDRLVAALESLLAPEQAPDPAAAERDVQQRVTDEQSRQIKMFDQLLGQVSAAGGSLGDVRSKLLTLLPGSLPAGLADKAGQLALDAGTALVTDGIKAAGQKVVGGLVSNAGDIVAAAVKDVLPVSDGTAAAVAGIAGSVATLVAGDAKPGTAAAVAGLAGSVATLVAGGTKPGAAQGGGGSTAGAVAGVVSTVASLLGDSGKTGGQVSAFDVAKTLGGALLSGSPAGLVSALVTVGYQLGDAEYQRWKARVLAAPYRPEFLPPAVINAASAIAALRLSPIFSRVFKPEMEVGDRLKLQEIAQCAVGPDDAFRAAFAARFASEAECAAGLREFRQVLLDRSVLNDASPLLQKGLSASEVLDAVDKARTDPGATEGLKATMQTIDQARAEKWDEQKTKAEIDTRLQAPT